MTCADDHLNACGCCEPPAHADRSNRPGLGEVAYRVGTHASFFRDMCDRLGLESAARGAHAGARPLAALGTRDLQDPAIAVLDSAAVLLDVVTFYQERLANEGFLGTATERLSVLHLARAIGYELSPGVAADVTLVFTLADTPGKAPSRSHIPAGTKVQSLPAQGALPQTFETVTDFTAHRAWNAVRPRTHHPQTLRVAAGGGIERLEVDGSASPTSEIVLAGTARSLAPGDLLLVHLDGGTTILRVTTVREDREAAVTRLAVEVPGGTVSEDPLPTSSGTAPGAGSGPGSGPGAELAGTGPAPMTAAAVADVLASRYSESDLQLVLADRGWEEAEFLRAAVAATTGGDPAPLPFDGVFVLRRRAGLFGHNAQPYLSLPISQREGEWHDVASSSVPPTRQPTFFAPVYPNSWEGNTVWEDSQGTPYTDASLYLERDFDDVLDTGWVVLEGDAATWMLRAFRIADRHVASRADYGLTGQVTALTVTNPRSGGPTKSPFVLRATAAHVASEWLELADITVDTPVSGAQVELDGMVLGLAVGQSVVLLGMLNDPEGVAGTEVAVLDAITHQHGRTTLAFADDLAASYVRDTVTVHANAVGATHGETVQQPLGGGDGAVANQSFALRGSPLTYVTASTSTGSASTLEVRVNGRRWEPVRSLYGAGPADQVYAVRIADDATATVAFGDGTFGARPPTGAENITARYRTGTGPVGEVDADTIQLLLTRPAGVTSVNNPLPAFGAEAPETLAAARASAPMTVRTLDRVVSLTDFEDFAATFAGIGKARADLLRLHGARLIHLTVGSASGGDVPADRIAALLRALDQVRQSGESVCASTYRQLSFDVVGAVKTDPALERETVLDAVRATLTDALSFDARRFAQGVSVAEILSVLHDVDGVIAADIDALEVNDASEASVVVPPFGVLRARPAHVVAGATALGCRTVEPADLLLLNPNGIDLGVMP